MTHGFRKGVIILDLGFTQVKHAAHAVCRENLTTGWHATKTSSPNEIHALRRLREHSTKIVHKVINGFCG